MLCMHAPGLQLLLYKHTDSKHGMSMRSTFLLVGSDAAQFRAHPCQVVWHNAR